MIVAWLSPGTVSHDFCRSLANIVKADPRIVGQIPFRSGPNLSSSRNQVARTFLEYDADWLWMIDSDMTFDVDLLDKLLEVADLEEAPIVGGLCIGQRYTKDRVEYFTTMFTFDEDGEAWRMDEYPSDAVVDIDATGTGCLLVHRSVFEEIRRNYDDPLVWFAEEINDKGGLHSEDITFCLRARACGFPVKVNTAAKVGHVKSQLINEAVYLAWLEETHGE